MHMYLPYLGCHQPRPLMPHMKPKMLGFRRLASQSSSSKRFESLFKRCTGEFIPECLWSVIATTPFFGTNLPFVVLACPHCAVHEHLGCHHDDGGCQMILVLLMNNKNRSENEDRNAMTTKSLRKLANKDDIDTGRRRRRSDGFSVTNVARDY